MTHQVLQINEQVDVLGGERRSNEREWEELELFSCK